MQGIYQEWFHKNHEWVGEIYNDVKNPTRRFGITPNLQQEMSVRLVPWKRTYLCYDPDKDMHFLTQDPNEPNRRGKKNGFAIVQNIWQVSVKSILSNPKSRFIKLIEDPKNKRIYVHD